MTASKPPIGDTDSIVIGEHALVSGFAASVIRQFLPNNWRAYASDRWSGTDLAEIGEGVAVLEAAAAAWVAAGTREAISDAGKTRAAAETRRNGNGPASREWITTVDAAQLLGVSARQVRNYANSGLLAATKEGQRWLVRGDQVLALRRRRDGNKPYSTTSPGESNASED